MKTLLFATMWICTLGFANTMAPVDPMSMVKEHTGLQHTGCEVSSTVERSIDAAVVEKVIKVDPDLDQVDTEQY